MTKVVVRALRRGARIVTELSQVEIWKAPLGWEAWYRGERVTLPRTAQQLREELRNMEDVARRARTSPEELFPILYRDVQEDFRALTGEAYRPDSEAGEGEVAAVQEACTIIRALLGAPPPRVWRKWPVVYRTATEYLAKHSRSV